MSGPSGLHIGNVANNAYLNAKLLRARGWQCRVFNNDYTHVMGCPEWEDARFDGSSVDEFTPNWPAIDLHGFERPAWFLQAPFVACAAALNDQLGIATAPAVRASTARRIVRGVWRRIASRTDSQLRGHPMVREYPRTMTTRAAGLVYAARPLAQALRAHDLVVAYGTSGWIPRAASVDYVAYEHGTIRNLPFEDSYEGRMCRDIYTNARHVIITNCDNDLAAKRLELKSWSFVPHPVNEVEPDASVVQKLRRDLCQRLDAEMLVVHPPRQHWDEKVRHPDWEKGNDIFIRGFAQFVRETGAKAGCVLIDWGRKTAESKALIAACGIADRVVWLPIQTGISLGELMSACDVVADQFWLGAFGSLTPKAMRLGRPVLLNLNEERHHWCFSQLPPVLNCKEPPHVAKHLERLWRDPAASRAVGAAGKQWYETFHSNEVIAQRFAEIIERLRIAPQPQQSLVSA